MTTEGSKSSSEPSGLEFSKKQAVAQSSMKPIQSDNTVATEDASSEPEDIRAEWNFTLARHQRLTLPLDQPPKHGWVTGADRNSETGKWNGKNPSTSWPIAPADNTKKQLFLNEKYPGMKWVGGWAAAKLEREVEKYEIVKEFWLPENNTRDDDLYEHAAIIFYEEMSSPWVCAWLRESIGVEEVEKIRAVHSRRARKD